LNVNLELSRTDGKEKKKYISQNKVQRDNSFVHSIVNTNTCTTSTSQVKIY